MRAGGRREEGSDVSVNKHHYDSILSWQNKTFQLLEIFLNFNEIFFLQGPPRVLGGNLIKIFYISPLSDLLVVVVVVSVLSPPDYCSPQVVLYAFLFLSIP